MISKQYVPLASHKKALTRENLQDDVSQVVILFWPSAFHCGFLVLISGIFPFVWKKYTEFSIHLKTSLPVTFTSIACWQVQAGGIGMETFRWAGWRDEAKKKVVGSGMEKAYVGPSHMNLRAQKQLARIERS